MCQSPRRRGFETVKAYTENVIFGYARRRICSTAAPLSRLCLALGDVIMRQTNVFTRAVAALDRVSYGVYLSHVLVLNIAAALLDLAGVQGLALRFVLSAAATYTITITAALIARRGVRAFLKES